MDKALKLKYLNKILDIMLGQHDVYRGICYHIELLYWFYTDEEQTIREFKLWFQKQKPRRNLHSKFLKNEYFTNGHWWWIRNEGGFEYRIEFLKHLIERESK